MILGTGLDICEVARIEQSLERFGDRFAERILIPEEVAQFQRVKRKASLLARRFAAKEALSKALGLGMRMPMGWRQAGVLHHASGKPYFWLADPLSQYALGGYTLRQLTIHLSITDDAGIAMAQVIIETSAPQQQG